MERLSPAGRVQRRRRLPHHRALRRAPRRPGLGAQPGGGGGGGGRRCRRPAAVPGPVVVGLGPGCGGVRFRGLHDGPERPPRSGPGRLLAAVVLRGPRPSGPSTGGTPRGPVGGPSRNLPGPHDPVGSGRADLRREPRPRPLRPVAGPGDGGTAPARRPRRLGRRCGPRRRAGGGPADPRCRLPGAVAARHAQLHVLRLGIDEQVPDRPRSRSPGPRGGPPVAARLSWGRSTCPRSRATSASSPSWASSASWPDATAGPPKPGSGGSGTSSWWSASSSPGAASPRWPTSSTTSPCSTASAS